MARKAQYVRCRVSAGFFETEFYVIVANSSVLVDRDSVKVSVEPRGKKEVEGKVLAYVLDERGDKALVELPGQAVIGGLRTWISKSRLAAP